MIAIIATVSSLIVWVLQTIGLPGLFVLMVVESFGLPPIPSEVILPFAGFLVAEGTFPFAGAVAISVAGGVLGAYAAYAVGRWWRDRAVSMGIGRLRLEPRHLARVDDWFARHGEATVGLSRLVPVIRSYISYPAGTARMDPARFGVYTALGATPFAVALIYAGMVLQKNWTAVSSTFSYLDIALIALVVLVALFLILQMVGVLAPGWPPRRASRTTAPSHETDSSGSPPRA
jgi:membrane protein DedA with SNARE-associated domain